MTRSERGEMYWETKGKLHSADKFPRSLPLSIPPSPNDYRASSSGPTLRKNSCAVTLTSLRAFSLGVPSGQGRPACLAPLEFHSEPADAHAQAWPRACGMLAGRLANSGSHKLCCNHCAVGFRQPNQTRPVVGGRLSRRQASARLPASSAVELHESPGPGWF
jgi:hypothetical protein